MKVTDRGATLEITNTDFSDGYQETLVVDAQTGVIEKMIGGDAGKTPSVTVTYDIKRVDANDYVRLSAAGAAGGGASDARPRPRAGQPAAGRGRERA